MTSTSEFQLSGSRVVVLSPGCTSQLLLELLKHPDAQAPPPDQSNQDFFERKLASGMFLKHSWQFCYGAGVKDHCCDGGAVRMLSVTGSCQVSCYEDFPWDRSKTPKLKSIYFLPGTAIPACTDFEVTQFPLRMRDWLKNILMQLYEPNPEHAGYLNEKQRNKVSYPRQLPKRLSTGLEEKIVRGGVRGGRGGGRAGEGYISPSSAYQKTTPG